MHWIDWLIVIVALGGLAAVTWGVSSYSRSVSDFLAAGRSGRRYLLAMASGMSGLGAISIVANFEKFYHAGFAAAWWGQILAPLSMILALTGWVVYRYRETRAMTLAQFFEVRYSRNFRVFTGILACLSGILNYGIFPAVTARFIIYFCGFPPTVTIAGIEVRTLAIVMIVMLGIALAMTMAGGQITVMVTDFLQGQFVNLVMLAVIAVIFIKFDWSQIVEGLKRAPEGQSRLNPFDQGNVPDFNVWFFMILAFMQVYGHMAWQGSQGYNASAINAHEAKMARILGEFRGMVAYLIMLLLPICVYAMLQLPAFAAETQATMDTLARIPDEQIRDQMTVPAGLAQIIPVGMMGLFAAVIAMAAISTDNTYLHSWGSILVQDVVMPFRKRPLSVRQHLWLLRLGMFGVAAFAFTFSLLFPLNEYIYMYFQITGAIFLGGAGSAIIGGLYWSRGSTAGAWAGMIAGSGLALTGLFIRNIFWPHLLPPLREAYPDHALIRGLPDAFPWNGVHITFFAAVCAILAYVVVSLLTRSQPVNMDKLLHRGAYALPGEHVHAPTDLPRHWRWLGITREFTRGDRAIYLLKVGWTMFFFAVFILGTVASLFWSFTEDQWSYWWLFQVAVTCAVALATAVWFLIGGFRDLAIMLRVLRNADRDAADDGMVRAAEHVGSDAPADPSVESELETACPTSRTS